MDRTGQNTIRRFSYQGRQRRRSRLVALWTVCVIGTTLLVAQALFGYTSRPVAMLALSTERHVEPSQIQLADVQVGMRYEICSVPTSSRFNRFNHWFIKVHSVRDLVYTFGGWLHFASNPPDVYFTCPDVQSLDRWHKVNTRSRCLARAHKGIGARLQMYCGYNTNFSSILNAVQADLLRATINSPTRDVNGVRLLRMNAQFDYLSYESIALPVLGLWKTPPTTGRLHTNCQLICSYFRRMPETLTKFINLDLQDAARHAPATSVPIVEKATVYSGES